MDEELTGLQKEIEGILPDADSHKIDDVAERLIVGNAPVNTRISSYSASQTYKAFNHFQLRIAQNFKDALTLRSLLYPDEYLSDVQIFRGSILGDGAFSHVYKGKWKENYVAVKKFRPVTPPVFLIPSDTIRCLTLNNLQEHIGGFYKVN